MEGKFKPIPGYEDYYLATESGKVFSIRNGSFMKGKLDKDGYRIYHLRIPGLDKHLKGHRIIALTFLKQSVDKPQVNHINGIKDDNRVINLEFCNSSENGIHSYRTLKNPHWAEGRKRENSSVGKAVEEINENNEVINFWKSMIEAAKYYNLTKYQITKICQNKQSKSYKGPNLRYAK